MNNKFSDDFYVVGHRGAAGEYFENSLKGILHAVSIGVDAIEIDIREHSSELWVIHDHDLQRLCGISGSFENQADISSLRLLNGDSIPTLNQVLDLTWGKVPLNIEIKSVQNLDLLLELLAQYPAVDSNTGLPWILISSFNHRALLDLRQRGCEWPLAPITNGVPIHCEILIESVNPWSWHFDDNYLDFELINELHEQNIPSMVFTVNDVDRAFELEALGVAGVYTDQPTRMLQFK
jgi:glycerophosphoryl diester phosphodiesterase